MYLALVFDQRLMNQNNTDFLDRLATRLRIADSFQLELTIDKHWFLNRLQELVHEQGQEHFLFRSPRSLRPPNDKKFLGRIGTDDFELRKNNRIKRSLNFAVGSGSLQQKGEYLHINARITGARVQLTRIFLPVIFCFPFIFALLFHFGPPGLPTHLYPLFIGLLSIQFPITLLMTYVLMRRGTNRLRKDLTQEFTRIAQAKQHA